MVRRLRLIPLLLICLLAAGCFGLEKGPSVTPKPGGDNNAPPSQAWSQNEAIVAQRLEKILTASPEDFPLEYIHDPLELELITSFNGNPCSEDASGESGCDSATLSHEELLSSQLVYDEDGNPYEMYFFLEFLALKRVPDLNELEPTFSPIYVTTVGSHIAAVFEVTIETVYFDPQNPQQIHDASITMSQQSVWEKIDGEWLMTELVMYHVIDVHGTE